MRRKKNLWILPIVLILAMVMIPIPVKAPYETRLFVRESPPGSYIPGVTVDGWVWVTVDIESPIAWDNTENGIVGWEFDVHVDPDVLTVWGAYSATLDYFLFDFVDWNGYSGHSPSILVSEVNETTGDIKDISEFIMGYGYEPGQLSVGAGGNSSDPMWYGGVYGLVRLRFRSKSETAHTLIDISDAYYYVLAEPGADPPWERIPFDVVDDGHYNEPIPVHDIAVTDVTPSDTEVYQGETVDIDVTVENQGDFPETFNATVFYDSIPIETQTDISLLVGATTSLSFAWSTSGVAAGTYIISAEASVVPDETDTADNTYADGEVTVSVPPPPSEYTRIYLPNQWIPNGVSMSWHADDNSWSYTLPFDFPFYGTYYTTIYISSNGLITFLGPDSSYGNSISGLATRLAIAPAWDDWTTYTPWDIYIWQPDADHVIIRWEVAALYDTSIVANFEVILGSDGVIQFNYGHNNGPISATIGISNGVDDILAEDVTNLNYINTILFTPYRPEHELEVRVEAPSFLKPGDSWPVNATVHNRGLSNETDVELYLLIDGTIVKSATIPELAEGTSYTFSYLWTPTLEATYNVTGYAPPVPEETLTANNRVTKFVTVTQPLIQPEEGKWANYTVTFVSKETGSTMVMLLNSTYRKYIYPHLMNVTLWTRDPYGETMTSWLTLNVMTREVEAGMWAGMWYPLWIQTNVTLGSEVRILDTVGTVMGSRFVVVGEVDELLIDSWELQVHTYYTDYIFFFDKVTGLLTGTEGESPYSTETWKLTATNALKLLRVEISPESGPVGTEVTVTGGDATPSGSVEIYWDDTLLGTTTADALGDFSLILTVPPSTMGRHHIRALDLTTRVPGVVTFTVVPSISIAPMSGPVGTRAVVTGYGYGPQQSIVLSFDDMRITEVFTDDHGSFTATFSVPLSEAGIHLVKGWYDSNYVEATFTVVDVSPLDVQVDVGSLYFKGETAEFYVQTTFKGAPIDITSINALLYKPDGTTEALTRGRIATGLYKITYTLHGKESMKGTYTLAVEAEYATSTVNATGASIKTFIVKEAWKEWEREVPNALSVVALIGAISALAIVWRKKYQQE